MPFIASREVRGTENFPVAEHSYWVKDEDGDVTTTDDQTIIRGGSAEVDEEEVMEAEGACG
ncbi:MAG: hypothetical protein EOM12_17000 [Verrucomicrobiae bacterium]|nr:hypothetical protein [Verrucomicrobiae bacterium]